MREIGDITGIRLRRESNLLIVSIEVGDEWVDVIREHQDGPISHIVESVGILKAIDMHFGQRVRR